MNGIQNRHQHSNEQRQRSLLQVKCKYIREFRRFSIATGQADFDQFSANLRTLFTIDANEQLLLTCKNSTSGKWSVIRDQDDFFIALQSCVFDGVMRVELMTSSQSSHLARDVINGSKKSSRVVKARPSSVHVDSEGFRSSAMMTSQDGQFGRFGRRERFSFPVRSAGNPAVVAPASRDRRDLIKEINHQDR